MKLDVIFQENGPPRHGPQAAGIVTDKQVINGRPQLECDLFVENPEGTRLVIGTATVTLPTRE